MIQALGLASHLVCFEICRFIEPGISDRSAFHLGDLTMYLPCCIDHRLGVAHIPYRIAALVHCSGNSRIGKYSCVISCRDRFGDLKWLVHDDNCMPTLRSILPEWFTFDITHVWLIRRDKYIEWKQPPSDPPTQEDAMAKVLAQLRAPFLPLRYHLAHL